MDGIIFNRIWEMPNSNTFDIKCINKLIYSGLEKNRRTFALLFK